MEKCLICKAETQDLFKADVLKKYKVSYYHCPYCGFVFTEKPYWLEEAYHSAINLTDTGYVARNEEMADAVRLFLHLFGKRNFRCVDFAGGYGMFVRLMRDRGYNFYWQDAYCENLFARGYGYQADTKYDFLTAFEVFEHLSEPTKEIDKMLQLSDTLLFSTVLSPNETPLPTSWPYLGIHHGQHISFYARQTLAYIAKSNGMHFYTNGKNLHIFSKKPLNPMKRFIFFAGSKWGNLKYRKAYRCAIQDGQILLNNKE